MVPTCPGELGLCPLQAGESQEGLKQGSGRTDFHFPDFPPEIGRRVDSGDIQARVGIRKLLYVFPAEDEEILMRWK